MSFCSPLWLAASALALKATTANVAAESAMNRDLPLLQNGKFIVFSSQK
jgi:hypothetical protein